MTGKWSARGQRPSVSVSPGPPPTSPMTRQRQSSEHRSGSQSGQAHHSASTPRVSNQTHSFVPAPSSPGPLARRGSLSRRGQNNSYAPPVQSLSFVPPLGPNPASQNGSFVPPPPEPNRNAQHNSYAPPPTANAMPLKSFGIIHHGKPTANNNSYIPPDSSPMSAHGCRPCLTPDHNYPHSLEPSPLPEAQGPCRQSSMAAPPPPRRMLSFDAPVPALPWMLPNPVGRCDSVKNLNPRGTSPQRREQAVSNNTQPPSQRSLSNEPRPIR